MSWNKINPFSSKPQESWKVPWETFYMKNWVKKGKDTCLSLASEAKLIPESVEPKRAFDSCSIPSTDWGTWSCSSASLPNWLFGPCIPLRLPRQLLEPFKTLSKHQVLRDKSIHWGQSSNLLQPLYLVLDMRVHLDGKWWKIPGPHPAWRNQ